MEKQRWEELENRSREEARSEKRKSQKSPREKVEESRIIVFAMICGPERSKSRLAKATAGA